MARALGFEKDFVNALAKMRQEQRGFILEEEQMLVNAIRAFIKRHENDDNFFTSAQLWTELQVLASDTTSFMRRYRNAITLGKKIWAMQESLSQTFSIEWQYDTKISTKVWRFKFNG